MCISSPVVCCFTHILDVMCGAGGTGVADTPVQHLEYLNQRMRMSNRRELGKGGFVEERGVVDNCLD